MVDRQCEQLMEYITTMNPEERVTVIIGLAKIPIQPIEHIIKYCLKGLSSAQFSLHAVKYLIDDEYLLTLEQNGCHFLTENESLVGMIGLYLHKSNVPITVENVRKNIRSITKTVIENFGLPKSGLIFPSSKGPGLLHVSIPNIVLTRTMEMVSETNNTTARQIMRGPRLHSNHGWVYTLESEKIYINGGNIFFKLCKTIKYGISELSMRFMGFL